MRGIRVASRLLILLVGVWSGLGTGLRAVERPNVILILTDDQGWADIGWNNSSVYSPNLDRLAAGGITFGQHYVMPQCTPTRVALMTGRYPGRFGRVALAATNDPAIPLGTPTLATMFKAVGYDTYLAGKWHLGSDFEHRPNAFGFDSSYGSYSGAVGMYDHRYRPGQFERTWHRDGSPIEGDENGTHATDLVKAEAIRVIQEQRESPYFLYIPFHSVHTPLDERGEFVDRPTQLDPNDPTRWLNEDEIPWFNDPDGKIQQEPDPEKRLLLAAVHHLDSVVGEIVAAVEASPQRDNTLILFSSDNGPQRNWPGNAYPDDLKLTDFNQPHPFRGSKTDVWEGGIHVPGFAYWPGMLEPRVIDEPVHIVDWFPTLANLVGYEPDRAIAWDGVDLEPLIRGEEIEPRELYWIWSPRTNRWALRYGDWKIVKYGTGTPVGPSDWQLFNLVDDPAEAKNIAEQHPEIVADLHARFQRQHAKDADDVGS
ncbi:MAG: sulfatase-like hydrolase/transferase [Planctomycetales bacterium]|nr:sulfatase-like hydrolase/transferase [Planctomycetales bacterium]